MRSFYAILLAVSLFNTLKGQDYETQKAMTGIYKHARYKKAIKHPESATKVYIKNYTDSVFPNESILQFRNLVSLAVRGGYIKNAKGDSSFFPKMRIDTTKLKQLTQLRYLSFDGVDFSSFPNALCGFRQLKGLTLAVCKIKALPPCISELQELSYLELRLNYLAAFPVELERMQNLEVLDLCNNRFTSIPSQFIKLTKLRVLWLDNVESHKFRPATAFLPSDLNINKIDYLAQYETVQHLLSFPQFERIYAELPSCNQYSFFMEKLRLDGLQKKATVGCR